MFVEALNSRTGHRSWRQSLRGRKVVGLLGLHRHCREHSCYAALGTRNRREMLSKEDDVTESLVGPRSCCMNRRDEGRRHGIRDAAEAPAAFPVEGGGHLAGVRCEPCGGHTWGGYSGQHLRRRPWLAGHAEDADWL